MSRMAVQFVELVMGEEQAEPDEEKEEAAATDEAPSIGHAVNMYHYVLVA